MTSLLLAFLLTAAPADSAPRNAVWIQPVVPGFMFALDQTVGVPLGLNLPLTDNIGLGLELTPVVGRMGSVYNRTDNSKQFWRVLAAGGLVISPGGKALSGFFVEPKLIALLGYEPDYSYDNDQHLGGTSLELQLGVDVGWQFVWGPIYFAPMIGASAGPCLNCSLAGSLGFDFSHVYSPLLTYYSPLRGTRAAVGLNLNLVRVGMAF